MHKMRDLRIFCIFMTVALFSLCIGQPQTPSTPAESIQKAPTQEISAIINEINPTNPESFHTAEELVDLGRSAVPGLLDLLNSSDTTARSAALYALSRLAQPVDIPDLMKGLDDPDLGNRAVTAAILLWLGDDRGILILEEASQSDRILPFSNPPEALSDYAQRILEQKDHITPPTELQPSPGIPPVLEPNHGITVTVTECVIEITLNLQVIGDGATEALAAMWADAIKEVWDGRSSTGPCITKVTVNYIVTSAEPDPNYFPIIVRKMPHPGAQHASYVWYSGNDPVCCEWDSNDTGLMAAHEVGHILGLDDDTLMRDTSERHIDEILMVHNLQCPPECNPDLVVEKITINPGAPKINSTVIITAVIANKGKMDVEEPFSVECIVDGKTIETKDVEGLEKEASATISFITNFKTQGDHTIKIYVDSKNTVEESDENNNEKEITAAVTAEDKPDLTITDITAKKEMGCPGPAICAGDMITIKVIVENQGTTEAKGFTITVDVQGTVQESESLSLDAGKSKTIEFMYKLASSGSYTVSAVVDPHDVVEESNEKNNTEKISVTASSAPSPTPPLSPPPQELPDLAVTSIEVYWIIMTPPVEIRITKVHFTVTNYGTTVQGPIEVQVWLDDPSNVIGTYTSSTTLAKGESFSDTVDCYHTDISPDEHTVGVTVDPQNAIQESNENNNTLTEIITEKSTYFVTRHLVHVDSLTCDPMEHVRFQKILSFLTSFFFIFGIIQR